MLWQVMKLVELTPLRNSLVGVPGSTGLSVEQRKRLTIAVELVANPSIIFMDEPTTGENLRQTCSSPNAQWCCDRLNHLSQGSARVQSHWTQLRNLLSEAQCFDSCDYIEKGRPLCCFERPIDRLPLLQHHGRTGC